MNIQTKFSKNGFTLIETLVSLSILSVSITALLYVVSGGIKNLTYVKSKLTASYLAQEGIELVRNARDTMAINNTDPDGWINFLEIYQGKCNGENGCIIENDKNIIPSACNSECQKIKYNENTGYYDYLSGGKESLFSRSVRVFSDPDSSQEEVTVVSRVVWSSSGVDHEVVMTEQLFDWR